METTHVPWPRGVDKAGGLCAVDGLREVPKEEGVLDIERMDWPRAAGSEGEDTLGACPQTL